MRHLLSLALSLATGSALAQEGRMSHCISLVENVHGLEVIPAAYTDPVPGDSVRITYIDHSQFLIQTEGGLSAITDYNGWIGPARVVPDVVTMNNAHSSHWTALPDQQIPHILEGWGTVENPQRHHLDLEEMLVRNVHTNTRSGMGERINGNSIFVFEAAGLCIGHLGHLHHEPTSEQYAAIGRLDVVMAAVDGGLTVDLPTMVSIIERFRSSVVIPMHWFGRATLDRFLDDMDGQFAIERVSGNELTVSLRTLPDMPTIMVLEPRLLSDE
ncbi:MBL fold metallo-hydrolase [Pelagovum pacificum]|uniref:MBL fold metallo-hydrolase n=1 Tax=Pelagovum pacificum TaxID=2588711 RepID=A0A5C5GDB2_9RHOB|nr:MBL fold metallo-hydrolase [Pelagovum pacificum]QQA44139.1 MBL fold metallo-hydrolase [Pelagovum pacificum]TNY32733.1 MBL fold metallo-hydrolase [Pelagovum pacificum]